MATRSEILDLNYVGTSRRWSGERSKSHAVPLFYQRLNSHAFRIVADLKWWDGEICSGTFYYHFPCSNGFTSALHNMWSTEWFETGIAVIFLIPSSSSLLLTLLLVACGRASIFYLYKERSSVDWDCTYVKRAQPSVSSLRKLIIDRLSAMSIRNLSFTAESKQRVGKFR